MLKFYPKQSVLFPTPMWEVPIENVDNLSIKEYILKLRQTDPGVEISNKGGWHSNDIHHPLPPALEELISDLTLFINDYCKQTTDIDDLVLGNWWVNINGKNDYNIPHDHQNSVLSAVYYVEVPNPNTGDLIIHRDDNSRFFLGKYRKNKTHFSSHSYSISPNTGQVIIFPSWMKHSVEKNNSDAERISIAFNFVIQG